MIRIVLVLAALAVSTPALAIGGTGVPGGVLREGCKEVPFLWGWLSRVDCSERPLPPGCQRLPYNNGLDYLFGNYVSCAPREKGAR